MWHKKLGKSPIKNFTDTIQIADHIPQQHVLNDATNCEQGLLI